MELNSNEIQKIIPHRYPFLLVDRITDFEPGKWARGIKCVSANEMQFMGQPSARFPDFPGKLSMPGFLASSIPGRESIWNFLPLCRNTLAGFSRYYEQ